MALGTFPVKGTSSCACEWIESGRTGMIVSPHDTRAMAEALVRAATGSSHRVAGDSPLVRAGTVLGAARHPHACLALRPHRQGTVRARFQHVIPRVGRAQPRDGEDPRAARHRIATGATVEPVPSTVNVPWPRSCGGPSPMKKVEAPK